MRTSLGGEPSENLQMFSLSELSFLIKILNKININEDYKNYVSVVALLNAKGVEVISEDNLQVDHGFINGFQRKIRAVRKGRWKE